MLIPPARATMVLPPSMGGQKARRRPSPRPGTSAPRDGPEGRERPAFERAGSLFARQIDTICDGRLQGLAAVRQIGRERGVKAQGQSRPAGAPVVAAGGVKGGGSSQGSCQGSRSHSRKSTDELRPGG